MPPCSTAGEAHVPFFNHSHELAYAEVLHGAGDLRYNSGLTLLEVVD